MDSLIENAIKRVTQFPTQLLLIAIGALLFIPFIGNVHLFDWDEINFAESAREMLLTHNYRHVQINFEPFYEKPPLFIWLQSISMKFFGINEYAARLPNAICGIFTMLVVFNTGRYVFKSQFGVLWSLLLACSILPQIYFKSGIIDPVFNLFIFLGVFYMFRASVINEFEPPKITRKKNRNSILLSGFFIGLATLTKGPVAILLAFVTGLVYLFANRGKLKIEISQVILWWLVVFVVIIAWLSFEIHDNGLKFIDEFVAYQVRLLKTEDAGHGGPFYYHFLVLLLGVFPASGLIFDSFRKNAYDDTTQASFKKWMIYLLCVVLVIFTVVKTKIVHYSSLCYFPITFLAAYYLNYLFDKKMKWTWRQTVPLLFIGIVLVSALSGGLLLIQRPYLFMDYVKDDFAKACLQAPVYWSNNDLAIGIIYLVSIIIAILLTQTKHTRWGVYLILVSSAFFISSMMTLIVPRVEKFSQSALIEFLESKQNESCRIETAGFKSYAHYFYARKPIPAGDDKNKTLYVVTKVSKINEVLASNGNLKELYRKNGWVFFVEQPAP
jgi:4-amino-4-deoxy-L-arabinose transferase-like glycosyltransferase